MTLAIGVVWFHRNIHHKDCLSAVVSIFGILATFLVVALVPVDVFLVSYFKYSNGTYRVSATQTHDQTCCCNIAVVLGVGFFKYDKKWFDGRSIVHVLRYQFLTSVLSEIIFEKLVHLDHFHEFQHCFRVSALSYSLFCPCRISFWKKSSWDVN